MFTIEETKLLYTKVMINTKRINECDILQTKLNRTHEDKLYNSQQIVWSFHNPDYTYRKGARVTMLCDHKRCVRIEHLQYSIDSNSKEGVLKRLKHNALHIGDCLVATNYKPNQKGYGEVNIKGKTYLLHRAIWWIYSDIKEIDDLPGSDTEEYIVRHGRNGCTNKLCLNKDHYELGNASDNRNDMIRDGTLPFGEKHSNASITLRQAQQIADSWKPKDHLDYMKQSERATMFKVSIHIVASIDKRKSWKEVEHPNGKLFTSKSNKKTLLISPDMMSNEDWNNVLLKIQSICNINVEDNIHVKSPCWEAKGKVFLSYKARSKLAYIWACEYTCKRFIESSDSTRHLCGNGPNCCNPTHLVFGTAKEQSADQRDHGTSGTKLNIETARLIRNDSRSYKDIAQEYDICLSSVSHIKNGRNWKEEKILI